MKVEQSDSRCCTACGQDKPLSEFEKWRRGDKRAAWYCDVCRVPLITERTRRYRSDPENAELDRERSRAWKERNREANRARDRARARDEAHRGTCTQCGGLMGTGTENDGTCKPCQRVARIERATEIARLWADGWTMKRIAAEFGYSLNHMAVEFFRIRRDGLADLPHRYSPERRAAMKAGRSDTEVQSAA